MLILTRKLGEEIMIYDNIEITVLGVWRGKVKLGINAPRSTPINREEVFFRIQDELADGISNPKYEKPITGSGMLVLTRNLGESIIIGTNISVTVLGTKGHGVRLGIKAPSEVPVHRREIYDCILAEKNINKNYKHYSDFCNQSD